MSDSTAEDAMPATQEQPDVPSPSDTCEEHHCEGVEKNQEERPLEDADGQRKSEKDKGNEEYAKGRFEEAAKAWGRSLQSVKYILDKGFYGDQAEQLREVHQMELRLCLNMSQCQLKLKDWRQAETFAERALVRDPNSAKALYRKATALNQLGQHNDAVLALQLLLRFEPDNTDAKRLLVDAQRREEHYEKKLKKVAGRMFASVERDPRVEPTMYQWVLEQVYRILYLPFEVLDYVRSVPQQARDHIGNLRIMARRRLKALTQRARRKIERMSPSRTPKSTAPTEDIVEDEDALKQD